MTIVLIGAACALVVVAVIAKIFFGKPRKAEKWEKAQIVKQLVALSEREDTALGTPRQQSVSKSPALRHRAAVGRH